MRNKKKSTEFVDIIKSDPRIDAEDLRLVLSSKLSIYTSIWIFGMGVILTIALGLNALPNDPLGVIAKLLIAVSMGALYIVLLRRGGPEERLQKILAETDYLEAKGIAESRERSQSGQGESSVTNELEPNPPSPTMAQNKSVFNEDLELKIIDIASEEVRNAFYTRFGAYLSILTAIIAAFFTLSVTGTATGYNIFNFIALIVLVIVAAVISRIAYRDAINYRKELHRMDDLIADVRKGRSLQSVEHALRRIRGEIERPEK